MKTESNAARLVAGDLLVALLLSTTGAWWLALVHPSQPYVGAATPSVIAKVITILSYALPLTLLTIPALRKTLRRRGAGRVGTASAVAVVAAAAISVGNQGQLLLGQHLPGNPAALPIDGAMLLVATLPLACLTIAARLPQRTRRGARRRLSLLAGAAAVAVLAALGLTPAVASATVSTSAGDGTCLSGGPVDKTFDVTAIDLNITVNRYGDHDPNGKMYALTADIPAIRAQEATKQVSSGLRDDAIQPLIVRANEGDCVEVTFHNDSTGGDVGLHIDGVDFNASSSGDSIGANPSSAVAAGGTTTYRYSIPVDPRLEGAHYIHPGPGNRQAVDHGLFGALIVEPPGSTYWNPTSGRPQLSGWEAIVKPGGIDVACVPNVHLPTCGFREGVLLHHEFGNDAEVLTDVNGELIPVLDDLAYRAGSFALNYRSEPFVNRIRKLPQEKAHAYSSVVFGDPATPIMRGYLGDPTKIRILHAGGEKFHIFHLHGGGDRWRFNPVADPTFNYAQTGLQKDIATEASPSTRLDSQSIGPGEAYDLEIEGGAGGVQQSVGDFLFHCHISKHYVAGMWGMWRVYNTLQPDLVAMADRPAPAAAVDSRGLIGHTYNGTKLTSGNLDSWIRPQLPTQGIPRGLQDATVWNWMVTGNRTYLGAPADPTVAPDSALVVPGQPNLLAVDKGHIYGSRPAILFDPVSGRPAYPMLRTTIGRRLPFTGAGHTGSPYLSNTADTAPSSAVDPYAGRPDGLCPAGRKVRTYNVVSIAKAIPRSPTFTDPEGKLFVLAHDKAATYADPAKSDPLAIRANVGECVALTLTNEIPDAAAFNGFSKTSMHIHHVQFDVQGSDGVSTGYAYENSVRPYQVTDAQLTAAARAGDKLLHLADVSKLVGRDANGKATRPWIAVGEGLESIDIQQVMSVDVAAKTVRLMGKLASDHATGEYAGTEFIQSRWYPDAVLDNVFWHDHVDGTHGWGHGLVAQLIVEPRGSTYHDPVTGAEVDSGTLVDIHTSSPLSPGQVNGSFRELALWTINDNDLMNFSTLNLKANPLADRPDKANQFSSYTYGDPMTPLPRLYANDPLVVRTINISPTLDTLHVQGGRTLIEPRYTSMDTYGKPVPEAAVVDTIHYGISEKYSLIFNGESPTTRMQPGDYLYTSGDDFRAQQGAWGIVRILPGKVPDLRPLDNVAGPVGDYTLPTTTGKPPADAAGPGNPCPSGAPARSFAVTAMDRASGNNGGRTAYVPNGDVPAVQARTKAPVPLVLHVVAGECVTVHLTNALLTPVGFSVGKLLREGGSGGVNVGFSANQNTAPGATRDYVYYVPADSHISTAAIADLANATTLKAGLYGAVVVSPASTVPGPGTEFSDPVTGVPRDIGAQVLVHIPGAVPEDHRDFTVLLADDDAAIGGDAMPYPLNANVDRQLINYQHAPAGDGPTAFTDPGPVPWLTSYVGDPVTVHALVAPGSENSHSFSLGGLRWQEDPFLPDSDYLTTQGMGPWESMDAVIVGGAGGTGHTVGDFFYGDLRKPFTVAGMWGLQRVLPKPTGGSCPIRLVDGSTC